MENNQADVNRANGAVPTELTEKTTVESPFCGSLRSKKFFMMDVLATQAEQYIDASNHCWCRETQRVAGPDGGRVVPERCVPGSDRFASHRTGNCSHGAAMIWTGVAVK